MMNRDIRTILVTAFWTALCAGLGVLCLSAAKFKKHATLKEIAVEIKGGADDTYFMRPEDIQSEIIKIIGPLSKHTVGDVSCDIIEATLSENPFIENVDVFVSGNAVLTARITQRKPVLRVIADGQNYYLDEAGKKMPVSQYYTPRVHVLTGNGASKHAEELLELVRFIKQDKTLNALIGQLEYTTADEVILIPAIGRAQILFGKAELIAEKFENLSAFYEEVLAESGWEQYRTIDLRYRNQIICKKNPTS
jgi:cell division protein FtsQ